MYNLFISLHEEIILHKTRLDPKLNEKVNNCEKEVNACREIVRAHLRNMINLTKSIPDITDAWYDVTNSSVYYA